MSIAIMQTCDKIRHLPPLCLDDHVARFSELHTASFSSAPPRPSPFSSLQLTIFEKSVFSGIVLNKGPSAVYFEIVNQEVFDFSP